MTRYLWIAALACVGLLCWKRQRWGKPSSLPAEPPCLRQGYIYGFQPVPGNRSLVVTDQARHRYRLNFMGTCYNLQYHLGVGFKTHAWDLVLCRQGRSGGHAR